MHSQIDRSPSTWSFWTLFGILLIYASAPTRTVTGRGVRPASKRMGSPAARSMPSPLRCRKRTVCGSGAVFCVALFPLSHLLLRRSFRLCGLRLPGRPVHAERAAQRPERVASVCARVSAREREVRGRAALRACCARCAWRMLAILGAGEAHARRQSRWCAARRVRRLWWRARWRGARFARVRAGGRRVRMRVLAGSWCRVWNC